MYSMRYYDTGTRCLHLRGIVLASLCMLHRSAHEPSSLSLFLPPHAGCGKHALWSTGLSWSEKRQNSKWKVTLCTLNSYTPPYNAGYWKPDKARMSSVVPEEPNVINCSPLLTPRDGESECAATEQGCLKGGGDTSYAYFRIRTLFVHLQLKSEVYVHLSQIHLNLFTIPDI